MLRSSGPAATTGSLFTLAICLLFMLVRVRCTTLALQIFQLSRQRINSSIAIGLPGVAPTMATTTAAAIKNNHHSGIVMILSPAKTLDLTSGELPLAARPLKLTLPDCSPAKTREIATRLKAMPTAQLTKLLKLSPNLAKTTAGFYQNFQLETDTSNNSKPCVFAYSGAAFQGLDAPTLSTCALQYLQQNLRILSAVYGALRPLDQIQPYRLELATKLMPELLPPTATTDTKPKQTITKLADYWKDDVTASLTAALQSTADDDASARASSRILLNLASDEYAAAVNLAGLAASNTALRCIKIVFWEHNDRVVTVHTKRARGLFVRYIAEQQVTDMEGIKAFCSEGYTFKEETDDGATLVFSRPKQLTMSKKRPAKEQGGKT